MNTQSSTPDTKTRFGVRWMLAALLILFALGSAHAQNRTRSTAQLNISVTVMPIVQAQQMAQAAHRATNDLPIVAYHLQPIVLKQTTEIRDKSATARLVGTESAVLETVTSVVD